MRHLILLLTIASCQPEGLQASDASSGKRGGSVEGVWDAGVISPDAGEAPAIDAKILVIDGKKIFDLGTETRIENPKDADVDVKVLVLGQNCKKTSECASGFCTDGVCCQVAKCIDTCIPSGLNSCPVYSGWTCAPYGTCRAF